MRAIITGVGHHVPERKLTNADLEKMVDTNNEWIITRTGIRERRILEKEKGTSEMAVPAAQAALSQAGVSPDELDMIITATVTPDQIVPSMAAMVQKKLGASNCWGYDINGGCTGFLCAFTTAAQFIESGRHQKILVIGADKMSAIVDYKDRNTCILFGDGAGAVVMEPSPDTNEGVQDFILHLDGNGENSLYMTGGGSLKPATLATVNDKLHYIYQDGRTVFKAAVNGMAETTSRIIKKNGLTGSDISLFVPHQANYRIIDAVARKIGLNQDQVVVNIEKYGNTTAATIPLALSEAWEDRRMKKNDWIVMAAFGAGFTWGSVLLRWAM
ncbi:MAG: ketoacyl-ACP synthase III [Desulfobacterales bacterium]|nr:ketoacyl-ACP synthase III [Desulfobacterales bacterium]MCF8080947.1 ketoacyl-ACP synthase III [Desulfobacterales bacterium]